MDNNFNNENWQEQPTYYSEPEKPLGKNYDTTVLILGIVSAITAFLTSCICCCVPIPIVTSIIGIVFAFVTAKNGHEWNAMRIIGLVLCIVSLLGLILYFVYVFAFMFSSTGQQIMSDYMDIYNEIMSEYSEFSN